MFLTKMDFKFLARINLNHKWSKFVILYTAIDICIQEKPSLKYTFPTPKIIHAQLMLTNLAYGLSETFSKLS